MTAMLMLGVPIGDGWQLDRTTGKIGLEQAQTVVIHNMQGDVRVRAGAVEEIEWILNAQRMDEDPYRAELKIDRVDGRLILDVQFEGEGDSKAEWARRRADLTVLLPAQAESDFRTLDGLIEAKGIESPLQAHSTSGNIVLASAAPVKARTEHGTLKLDLKSDQLSTTPDLSTATGNIELWVPFEAKLRLSGETEGRITTDFSLSIERQGRLKVFEALISRDGAGVALRSIRGDIQLFQSDR